MERKDLAKIFHQTFGLAISKMRELEVLQELRKKQPGDYFLSNKPTYISQLGEADKDKIENFYGFINDEKAMKRFGASNLHEFSYWSWRACGVVALQMVLNTDPLSSFKGKTMDLVKEGLEMDGYDLKEDSGWYHTALIKLAEKYGFHGFIDKFVPSSKIALLMDQGSYVLCSVKSETGGHILLATGYRLGKNGSLRGLWFDDPSDFSHSGEDRYVNKKDFDKLSTRRIIVLNSK